MRKVAVSYENLEEVLIHWKLICHWVSSRAGGSEHKPPKKQAQSGRGQATNHKPKKTSAVGKGASDQTITKPNRPWARPRRFQALRLFAAQPLSKLRAWDLRGRAPFVLGQVRI